MKKCQGKFITPSLSPRIIVFRICITPLLAPSVRNMSSGSLPSKASNKHRQYTALELLYKFSMYRCMVKSFGLVSKILTSGSHHAFQWTLPPPFLLREYLGSHYKHLGEYYKTYIIKSWAAKCSNLKAIYLCFFLHLDDTQTVRSVCIPRPPGAIAR